VRKELIAVRYRTAALVTSLLAAATATLPPSGPASADVPGITLEMTQPGTFVSGGSPGTLRVVASDNGERPGCHRVRWTLVVRAQGVPLSRLRVTRFEDGPFPVSVQTNGDSARIVDQRFDGGILCRGRTVTATYAIAVTGGEGAVAFRSEPRDAAGRVLSTATSESSIVRKAKKASLPPSPGPSAPASASARPSPSPSESDDAAVAPPADPPAITPPVAELAPAARKDHSPSLLGPGLIVGGLLVFLGVGLLLRLRMRSRRGGGSRRGLPPTSFHPTYPSR
jgi:hypothetical protein